jgi:tetratricopeptide (TPR) repeat protein
MRAPAWTLSSVLGLAGLGCVSGTGAALARDIPYGAVDDPGVRHCDALNWSPQHAQAAACYRALVAASSDRGVQAEAAWALGDAKTANDWFRDALAAKPDSARLRARWGELYIDTHQGQEALDLFKEALQHGNDAYARLGAATVLADQYAAAAGDYLKPLMDDNKAAAGARLAALLLAARMQLEDGDAAKAAALLDGAESLARQSQLPQLDIIALRAAMATSKGESADTWVKQALAEDPAFGDIYAVPAHFAEITRRYRDAVALNQKAVQIQPDLWSARVELATGLLRDNRITEARTQLEAAYKGDPYDPVTANTLRLLDSLKDYDVLVYSEDQLHSTGTAVADGMPALILRLHKKESAVLAPYAEHLAQAAMDLYGKQFRFKLKEPVVVEVYPNHEDFAVRTAGMPGIGLLGVTFGYVLAMDSPSSRPVNEFHWGTTLWHELAHVYTLESTDHRVPRWLSEGLSVFEEWRSGPIKGEEIPGYAFKAFAQGKALPIAELDRGFIHPEYPQQVQVSYMQAGLICDFIDRSFGFDKLYDLLQQYRNTSDTATAVNAALGITATQFDQRFRADMQQQFGNLFAHLDDWGRERTAANADLAHSQWPEAIEAAKASLALQPQDVEDGSPYVVMARAQVAMNQEAPAAQTLEDYWKRGGHDPQALKYLAKRLTAAGRLADAAAVLQSVNEVAPLDYDLHGELGDTLFELHRNDEALAEYQTALALDPPDAAQAHYRLARAQFARNDAPAARRELLRSLEIAPNFKPAQQLLLELSRVPGTSQ